MQRRVAIAAVAVVGILSLTACSSSGSSGSGSGSKTLTVLTYQTTSPQKGAYDAFLAKCSKDGSGYTFKQLGVPQTSLITKATQLTASGDAPAMILADNNNVPTLADAGVLGKLPMAATGLKASDFESGPLKSGQYKGVQYGLPVGNNGEVIVYNKGVLSKAGVAVPKSWAELQAAAKKLTTGGKYGFGQSFGPGETLTWNWITQLWSNGGSLTNLTSQQSIDATNFWTSFIRNGTAPKASLNWVSTDLQGQFTGGQLPMVQVGTWVLPGLLADAKKAGIDVGITEQVSPTGSAPEVPFGGEIMAEGAGAKGDQATAVAKCIGLFSKNVTSLSKFDELLGYVPSYIPAQKGFLAANPTLQVMADQLAHARARTDQVGPKYAAYTTAMSTALQQVASGSKSAQAALAAAQIAANQ
jgi:multiple sugar transport system substrate-binding protein